MDKIYQFYKLEDGSVLTETEAESYINTYLNGRAELQIATEKDVEAAMRRSWVDLASTISDLLGEDYGPTVDRLYKKATEHLMELYRYKAMFCGWYI